MPQRDCVQIDSPPEPSLRVTSPVCATNPFSIRKTGVPAYRSGGFGARFETSFFSSVRRARKLDVVFLSPGEEETVNRRRGRRSDGGGRRSLAERSICTAATLAPMWREQGFRLCCAPASRHHRRHLASPDQLRRGLRAGSPGRTLVRSFRAKARAIHSDRLHRRERFCRRPQSRCSPTSTPCAETAAKLRSEKGRLLRRSRFLRAAIE